MNPPASFDAILAFVRDPEFQRDLIAIGVLLVLCVAAYYLARTIILRAVHAMVRRTSSRWDDVLMKNKVFAALALYAPALVLSLGLSHLPDAAGKTVSRIISFYSLIVGIILVNRMLSAVLDIYNTHPMSRRRPIKGYIQLIKIFVVLVGGVVLVASVANQSPWKLISGIGAATAVLLLIFKDTILSFVASINMAQNDIIRVGDWVTMDKYGADGDVIEIALHTVKIQNFDKTIVAIPTYKFIDEATRNWRGMQESGGRRIKRALFLDQSSVAYLTDDDLARLGRIQLLAPYLDERGREIEAFNREKGADPSVPVNGRHMTNLGTFRAYVSAYLGSRPDIRQDLTFLVRQLEPTPQGLPLEIYVFTNTTVWGDYEAIQSDIFDHLLATVPFFDLRLFQSPSGADVSRAVAAIRGSEEG